MVRALFLAILVAPFFEMPAFAAPAIAGAPSIVSAETLPRTPGKGEDIVILTPAGGAKRLLLREREKSATRPPPLPLFADLLEMGSTHAFGNDQRCQISRKNGKVLVRCRPGASVSGVRLLFGDFRLPEGAPIYLQLAASGAPGFAAEVTARGADANSLRPLGPAPTRLPIPILRNSLAPQLVIMAPKEGGELVLNSLELAAVSSGATDALSAWAWEPALWRGNPGALVAAARDRNVRTVFVTLEIADGEVRHKGDLGRFVRLAQRAGINVEAVEGDPRMVLPDGLEAALVRARAFADYQRHAARSDKLAGIQYDVEPYILGEWGEGSATYQGWAEAILKLSNAAGGPIDLVLPFWIAASEEGRAFLFRTSPAIRGLTVMSYRTQDSSLAQIAEPLLAWGTSAAKPVRLALESGPIADEVEQIYREAAIGILAVLPGSEPRILMLDKPGNIEGARMFELHQRVNVRGDRISFLGDEQAMFDLARRTSPAFSAWPSFAGFALHGLNWPVSEAGSTAGP